MRPLSPSLLQLVPELGRPNIHMRDPESVAKAIQAMSKDAHHKLQALKDPKSQYRNWDKLRLFGSVKIVADFDLTLSKFTENGNKCSTTHGVLEESQFMPDCYKKEATRLKDMYQPIEFDVNKSVEERIPKMIEWDGCAHLFDTLHQLDIPILIFSAGLGDIIKHAIDQQAKFYDKNMKLVSNFLHFDDSGKVKGYIGDQIIHGLNKNESVIPPGDYFADIKHRQNILLLGDSLGDLRMANGADHMECMLKIGFLNFKVEENFAVYAQKFDIVIVEDETLDVVNGIIKAISTGGGST